MKRLLPLLLLLLSLAAAGRVSGAAGNRIPFDGKEVFLSGLNLAWDSFADDVGPNPATPDLAHFEDVFQQMNACGANAMRLWVHTTGAHTPAWNGQMVSGPGTDTIADLQAILDLAHKYDCGVILCLWSFDMLRISNGTTVTDRSMAILTQAANRQSYIDNALIPMVQALKGNPGLLAWEIFNEPEGMSNEHGWDFNRHVPMADIQAFINQCAGAIHRTDPSALVSNGSWALIASTDVGAGNHNYYTDARLIAAGGDSDGTLDFYMVHYYDWAGPSLSPFNYPASHWQLDKPLVVAEFYPGCANCGDSGADYNTLYENGYAGAMGWSWTDIDPQRLLDQIADVAARHPDDILLHPGARPQVSITLPVVGYWYAQGVPIPLEASAQASGGDIQEVEFFMDGDLVGTATAAPYTVDAPAPGVGDHTFHATAVDTSGRRQRSEGVTVRVGRPELQGRLEAEDADYSGVNLQTNNAASGGACLDMHGDGYIQWTIPGVPAPGTYDVDVGYNLSYSSPKTNFISINGGATTSVTFDAPAGTWTEKVLHIPLVAGTNTLRITPSWGWMLFDYIAIPSLVQAPPPDLQLQLTVEAGQSHFVLQGPPGIDYELLDSTNLQDWTVLQSFNPDRTPAEVVTSVPAGQAGHFYRVRAKSNP